METKIVSIDLDVRSYDIYIGKALLFRLNDLIPQDLANKTVFIVTDKNVEPYALNVQNHIQSQGARRVEVKTLPAGEKTKSYKYYEEVCGWMLENGLSRDSLVVAVGGGVIGDLTGFCAATIMRGVPFVQIPTTLLSQVDSAVGGKTGINTAQGKNLVGSFYQPSAVIIDIEVLQTLPKRELLAGYAEVLKYGLIRDRDFFEWLEQNGERVCNLDDEALAYIISESCKAKAALVQADETEQGARALLNLGHTFGHALEAEAGYNQTLLHGEAVAIGMVMAFDLSYRMGLSSEADLERVEAHLSAIGLPTRASYIDQLATNVDRLLEIMRRDKKTKDGKMVFILVNAIGEAFTSADVPEDLVRAVIRDSLGGEEKAAQASTNAPSLITPFKTGMKKRWKSVFSSQA